MGFLTATILSGVAWDSIKKVGTVSIDKLKEGLKEWILDEQDYGAIVKKINLAPDIIRETPKLLEAYIDSQEDLKNIMQKAQPVNSSIQSHNTFNNSPNQQGNNNIIINNGSQIKNNTQFGGQIAHNITNIGPQPRKISELCVEILTKCLKKYNNESITITSLMSDAETHNFANILKEIFINAGWSVDGVNQAVYTSVLKGIILVAPKAKIHVIEEIGNLLIKCGLKASGEIRDDGENIEIIVGTIIS